LGRSNIEIAEDILNKLDRIWIDYTPLAARYEPLKLLKKEISSYGIPFFNQFLDGLINHSLLQKMRKTIKMEFEYPQEKRSREKLIEKAKETKYFFCEAEKKLKLLDLSEKQKVRLNRWMSKNSYYSSVLEFWQQAIILMHDGDFSGVIQEAQKGIEEAKKYARPRNINQFAGLKKESEAYLSIVDKRWWEITSTDFKNAIRKFEEALECYDRAESFIKIKCVPLTLVNLLRFIESPNFSNVKYLVKFQEFRDKHPEVEYAFRPIKKSSSERKRQRNLIIQYIRNVAFKIAALNIFEEFRTLTVELENFAWKTDNVHQEIKKKIPNKASVYNSRTHAPSIENFVDDCKILIPEVLPQSIIMLKDIYHDCKHAKIRFSYTPNPDKFAEDLINKIIDNYNILKDLKGDIGYLKEHFMRLY